MMKTQIGLGVLSIPATFDALGLIPGVLCLIAIGLITTWSDCVIGVFKLRHRHVYAIDDAGAMMFGRAGGEFFGFIMWLSKYLFSLTMSLQVKLLTVPDWVFVSGAGMLSLSIALNAVSSHGACTAIFIGIAAILGFGLSSIRTLGKMSWLAWVGVVSIVIAGKFASSLDSDDASTNALSSHGYYRHRSTRQTRRSPSRRYLGLRLRALQNPDFCAGCISRLCIRFRLWWYSGLLCHRSRDAQTGAVQHSRGYLPVDCHCPVCHSWHSYVLLLRLLCVVSSTWVRWCSHQEGELWRRHPRIDCQHYPGVTCKNKHLPQFIS